MKDRKTQLLALRDSVASQTLLQADAVLPRRDAVRRLGAGALAGLGWLAAAPRTGWGQQAGSRPTKRVPVQRKQGGNGGNSNGSSAPAPADHPLNAPLEKLYSCRETMNGVKDYTCTFARREEIRGELGEFEYIYMKCRNRPFGVYLYWLKPHAGREAIYAEGQYNGRLIVHETGLKDAVAGTLDLDPHGERAMKNSRHPITEAGITKMIDQFIEGIEYERRFGECEVRFFKNAKIEGRACSWFEVKHPYRRRQFRYHVLRVYIDDELNLPIRMEAYDWPRRQGERPRLIEEYTFMKIKLNVGLTDLAFDTRNPRYAF